MAQILTYERAGGGIITHWNGHPEKEDELTTERQREMLDLMCPDRFYEIGMLVSSGDNAVFGGGDSLFHTAAFDNRPADLSCRAAQLCRRDHRLAVVPRDARAGHRARSGRRAGDGRPLHVYPLDRYFHHRSLCRGKTRWQVAGIARCAGRVDRDHSTCMGGGYAGTGSALEGQYCSVQPGDRRDKRQRGDAQQPGQRPPR